VLVTETVSRNNLRMSTDNDSKSRVWSEKLSGPSLVSILSTFKIVSLLKYEKLYKVVYEKMIDACKVTLFLLTEGVRIWFMFDVS